MIDIPDGVQSQILSSFCDGKSISGYFHVLICNEPLRSVAFRLVRDAIVDRYSNLARSEFAKNNEEVRDVLDIIREEIRTYKIDTQSNGGRKVIHDHDQTSILRNNLVTKISEWCAIIDYFDKMRVRSGERAGQLIIWCGKLHTQGFGTIQHACVSTALWTVTTMDHFYDQLELNNHYLTHPATHASSTSDTGFMMPFGKLDVESESDDAVLQRILYSLNSDVGSTRYSILVPSQLEYEPTIGFALNDYPSQRRSLVCHWDGDDKGDFEYSLSRLGDNVIRILIRLDHLYSSEVVLHAELI